MVFQNYRVANVGDKVIGYDLDRAIVAPLIGVADLIADGMKFDKRLLLSFRAHPVEIPNSLLHRILNPPNDLRGAGFQFGREHLTHIRLAQRVSQVVVGILNAPLPSRLHFFCTAQVLAIEIKVLLDEGSREIRRK